MKKDGNRISLTIKEADEIREYLETLYAMEGTLDEDFNSECHRAGFYARNMCKLILGIDIRHGMLQVQSNLNTIH